MRIDISRRHSTIECPIDIDIRSEREAILNTFQNELGTVLESVDRQRVETLGVLQEDFGILGEIAEIGGRT